MSAPRPLPRPRQRQDKRLCAPALHLINDLSRSGVPFPERGVGSDELLAVRHPVRVGPSHDRSDVIQVVTVDEIAPVRTNKLRHQFPLSVYGYTPNGTPNCDKLSRVQIIHSRENFGAKFNNIACASLVGAELVGSNDALIRSQFVPSVGQRPYASPSPTNQPAPPFIACQSSGELSANTHSRFGAHETHLGVQPCEEAYPAARIRQCGRLKQGTADGSRTPLIAEATGRRAAVNRPPVRSAQVSQIGASALKRQSGRTLSPPTPPVRADAPPLSEPKEGR